MLIIPSKRSFGHTSQHPVDLQRRAHRLGKSRRDPKSLADPKLELKCNLMMANYDKLDPGLLRQHRSPTAMWPTRSKRVPRADQTPLAMEGFSLL